jgi:hypothetical protein
VFDRRYFLITELIMNIFQQNVHWILKVTLHQLQNLY